MERLPGAFSISTEKEQNYMNSAEEKARIAISHDRRAQALKLIIPPHSACLANEDRQAFYKLFDSPTAKARASSPPSPNFATSKSPSPPRKPSPATKPSRNCAKSPNVATTPSPNSSATSSNSNATSLPPRPSPQP